MFSRHLFSLFFLLLTTTGFAAFVDFSAKIAADDARKEADFVYRLLQEHLVELYAYQDSTNFLEGKNRLVSGNDSIPTTQWYLRLKTWVSSVHVAHLKIYVPNRSLETIGPGPLFFPSTVSLIDDRLFVENCGGLSSLEKGDEILSINGHSAEELISIFRGLSYYDGRNTSAADWIFSGVVFVREMIACGFGASQYKVSLKSVKDGSPKELMISSGFEMESPKEEIGLSEKEILFGDQYALMVLRAFSENTNEAEFRNFFNSAFKQIQARKIEHLIIDLRKNHGGWIRHGAFLLQFLANESFRLVDTVYFKSKNTTFLPYSDYKQRHLFLKELEPSGRLFVQRHYDWLTQPVFHPERQNHYSGKLYVLCSEQTSSAATIFLHLLQKLRSDALFIGRSPDGVAYGFSAGMMPTLNLPYSGFSIRLPLSYFRCFSSEDIPFGYSLTPQILTKRELSERDVELDTAMYLIRQLKP